MYKKNLVTTTALALVIATATVGCGKEEVVSTLDNVQEVVESVENTETSEVEDIIASISIDKTEASIEVSGDPAVEEPTPAEVAREKVAEQGITLSDSQQALLDKYPEIATAEDTNGQNWAKVLSKCKDNESLREYERLWTAHAQGGDADYLAMSPEQLKELCASVDYLTANEYNIPNWEGPLGVMYTQEQLAAIKEGDNIALDRYVEAVVGDGWGDEEEWAQKYGQSTYNGPQPTGPTATPMPTTPYFTDGYQGSMTGVDIQG